MRHHRVHIEHLVAPGTPENARFRLGGARRTGRPGAALCPAWGTTTGAPSGAGAGWWRCLL